MSTFKPVTPGQLACAGKMAKEKGVDSALFERGLNNGAYARYLDSLRVDGITLPSEVVARMEIVEVRRTPKSSKQKLVLLNYTNGDGSLEKAVAWGETMGLKKTDRDWVELISSQHSDLLTQLHKDRAFVIFLATTEQEQGAAIYSHVFGICSRVETPGWKSGTFPACVYTGFGSEGAWFVFRL